MAVVIRMKRMGRTNRPSYRISVADSRDARDGRTIESLGYYDPASPVPGLRLKLNAERALYWLSKGARASLTVASILRKAGVSQSLPAHKKSEPRDGRKKTTRTKLRRRARKVALQAAKVERRTVRLAARKAAAKAGQAGEAEVKDSAS